MYRAFLQDVSDIKYLYLPAEMSHQFLSFLRPSECAHRANSLHAVYACQLHLLLPVETLHLALPSLTSSCCFSHVTVALQEMLSLWVCEQCPSSTRVPGAHVPVPFLSQQE